MEKMYEGKINSPESYLKEKLVAESTIVYIADGSILPELPNLLTIGEDDKAETILVKNVRSDGGYDVQRAFEGIAKIWEKNTVVARNFTNYDYKTLIANINELDKNKANSTKIKTKLAEMTDDSTHRVVTDSEKETWNKVNNWNGTRFRGNIDELKVSGTYGYYNNSKKIIEGDGSSISCAIIVVANDTDPEKKDEDKTQIVITQNNNMYVRNCTDKSNSWTDWKKINAEKLADLTDDSSHRTVSDAEKNKWNTVDSKANSSVVEDLKKELNSKVSEQKVKEIVGKGNSKAIKHLNFSDKLDDLEDYELYYAANGVDWLLGVKVPGDDTAARGHALSNFDLTGVLEHPQFRAYVKGIIEEVIREHDSV